MGLEVVYVYGVEEDENKYMNWLEGELLLVNHYIQ